MSGIADYSTTAASNTSVGGVSIAEGMAPAGINNAIRAVMADIASYFTSGTYTPTITNVDNVASSSAVADFQYYKVGTLVTVSGAVNITVTAGGTTFTRLGISIPVASNFSSQGHCAGSGIGYLLGAAGRVATINADTTNDRGDLFFVATATGAAVYTVHFTYQIL